MYESRRIRLSEGSESDDIQIKESDRRRIFPFRSRIGGLRRISMNRYVECPECRVRYPEERLYGAPHDRPTDGKRYTVSCSVCGHQFDVVYSKNWVRRLRARVQG